MPQNETHCEFLFVTIILTRMKLHYPGLKYLKGNICACDMQIIYKNKGIYSKYQNRNRFYFIHPQWKLIWTEFFTWRNVILVWVLCKHPLDIFRNILSDMILFCQSAKMWFFALKRKKKYVSKLKSLSLRIMQFNLQYNYERRLFLL